MIEKVLGIMIENPYWMYYVKYSRYLNELDHPFRHKIDFVIDSDMSIKKAEILKYPVVAFYHRDPLKFLYPEVFKYAKGIEEICREQGIRLINQPDALSNSVKSLQLDILGKNGFNVAKAVSFENINELEGLDFYPLFIRNNEGHDSDNLTKAGPFYNFKDVCSNYAATNLHWSKHLSGRVAVQWIDTKGKDGLYRRYRAFVCGDDAVTGNVYISDDWYIHGANNTPNLSETPENNIFVSASFTRIEKDFFTSINKALDLEFSAVDYSYNSEGQIVIWEANPHPAFPSWVDNEPSRTKNTNLLSNYYNNVLLKTLDRH
jgi:hypothetical protein